MTLITKERSIDIEHLSDAGLEFLAQTWFPKDEIMLWAKRSGLITTADCDHVRGAIFNIAQAGKEEQKSFPESSLSEGVQFHDDLMLTWNLEAINGLTILEVLTNPLAMARMKFRKRKNFTDERIAVLRKFLAGLVEYHRSTNN